MSIAKQWFSRDRLDSAGEGAILVEDLLPGFKEEFRRTSSGGGTTYSA